MHHWIIQVQNLSEPVKLFLFLYITDTAAYNEGDISNPAEKFLKSAKPTNIESTDDLHKIILSGNVEDLKLALEQEKYNPADKDVYNFTTLHFAAQYGKLDVMKYLIEEVELSLSLRGARGATPLHVASEYGQVEVIQYLILKHADPDIQDDDGYLPVHRACLSKQLAAAKYLVKNMYQSNIDDLEFTNTGLALVHVAVESGDLDIILKFAIVTQTYGHQREDRLFSLLVKRDTFIL